MCKIAFFCIPAQGHTNPTLEVVRELIARGCEVRYYSYDALREKIEAAGAEFVSCDRYDSRQSLSPADAGRVSRDLAFSTKLLVDMTLAMDGALCGEMREWGPACIVADSMAPWGKLAALKLGIPFVSSTTTFAFNRYSAKIMKSGPGALLRTLAQTGRANRSVRRLREQGYPVKNALALISNDNQTETIVYTSREFQPCAETFSDRYTFVGPSVPPAPLPALRPGGRNLYISLGTVLNDNGPFYRNCVQALSEGGFHTVLSVGDRFDPASLGPLPENFRAERSVEQLRVLEQTDVFLTHCGMNSVNEALYCGVPLVLFPQTAEQGGVARRVSEMGAGVYLKENSAPAIRAAVEELLTHPEYRERARKLGEGFRCCGGARLAAEKILAAAAK